VAEYSVILFVVFTTTSEPVVGLSLCSAHSTTLLANSSTGVHVSKFASGIPALLLGVSRVIGSIATTETERSAKDLLSGEARDETR